MFKIAFYFLFLLAIFPIFEAERQRVTPEEFELINQLKADLLKERQKEGRSLKSKSEEEKLEKFKFYIDYFLKTSPDAWIINWIRYYDYDMPKIKEKLLKAIEFRQTNNVVELADWEVPDFVIKNMKFEITGLADDGTPICYIYPAKWDIRGALSRGHRNDLLKYGIKIFEAYLKEFNDGANKINATTGQVPPEGVGSGIIIVNLQNISVTQLSIGVVNFLAVMIKLYEEYYPLVAEKIIIFNAPSFFVPVFSTIKRFFSTKTLEGVELYGIDPKIWKPVLLDNIQENLIPDFLLKN